MNSRDWAAADRAFEAAYIVGMMRGLKAGDVVTVEGAESIRRALARYDAANDRVADVLRRDPPTRFAQQLAGSLAMETARRPS